MDRMHLPMLNVYQGIGALKSCEKT